jgi:hypothetical protein
MAIGVPAGDDGESAAIGDPAASDADWFDGDMPLAFWLATAGEAPDGGFISAGPAADREYEPCSQPARQSVDARATQLSFQSMLPSSSCTLRGRVLS